jgi:hypothetical protein
MELGSIHFLLNQIPNLNLDIHILRPVGYNFSPFVKNVKNKVGRDQLFKIFDGSEENCGHMIRLLFCKDETKRTIPQTALEVKLF